MTKTNCYICVGPHTGTVPVLALGPKILPVVELGVFLPVVAPCLNGAPSSRTGRFTITPIVAPTPMRHQCHNGDKEIVPITALVPQWDDFLVPIEALLLYSIVLSRVSAPMGIVQVHRTFANYYTSENWS